jgi:superfamily II DNA or RNA helicase
MPIGLAAGARPANPKAVSATDPSSLLARMRFTGTWRDYQAAALAEFDRHAADRKLHVVAAPGSGKTILGLELIRRLARPAIVLAPSLTIRNQWPARLVPLFLDKPPGPDEASHDLAQPGALTCTTYQALHALWAGDRAAALFQTLQAAGPITLVLDEAHHLRREWWNALQALVEAAPEARIIALTATPPYDAPFAEWARYEAVCGPIDLEIGIPELVRNGDLCPHQDHVVFSPPGADALELLDRRRQGIAALQAELRGDAVLLDWFAAHPWLSAPAANAEAVLENPEVLSAILVLLAASGRPLPAAPLRLLGVRRSEVPAPDATWLEVLLNALLFRLPAVFPLDPERARALKVRLHGFGVIEGNEVRLGESRKTFTLMAGSLGKIDSIVHIAAAESASLGKRLRMVILADHIRAGELPRTPQANFVPGKLGVVPVFETLRRQLPADSRLGALTGTLTILPLDSLPELRQLAPAYGIAANACQLVPLPGCPGYGRLELGGHSAVALVTDLFTRGAVSILTGTQSLLGEGWDAPAINSLVLASNSAAFMLSNQMRGRAIRIDPGAPDKVANIWHLANLHPGPGGDFARWAERLRWGRLDSGEAITSDIDLLQRRFRAFEGIANSPSTRIESGLERITVPGAANPGEHNRLSFALAHDRAATATRWQQSLGAASARAHVREIASPGYTPRRLSWYDTLGWLGVSAASSGAAAAFYELRHAGSAGNLPTLAMGLAGAAACAAVPKLLKAGWLLARNGSLEGSLRQVGVAVLDAMRLAGTIPGDAAQGAVIGVERGLDGRSDVVVHGLERADERLVLEAMAEILGPVRNPRYLLERRSWLGPLGRSDFHAVPAALGRTMADAERFAAAWRARVGASRLVFTRTAKGRRVLLQARARSFAAGFRPPVDRRSAWL